MDGFRSLWPEMVYVYGAERLSQKEPDKLIDKLISYVLQARRLREKVSYLESDIIAMDETAV